MDINVFYDQLANHGTWVQHPDYRYVFIPADVGPGWRPYQEGRWVWTDSYGWYWDSDEPFGWATYHYGRWSYDPAYGWFWVPGDTWAPAWVKWRRGGGHTGWAPVAPDREGFATGRATHYDAPVAESWVFIDDQYMGEPDIGIHAAPIPEISVYLRAAPQEYDPVWQNGYYVNRGVELRAYDRVARTRIVSREIVEVDRSDDLFYDDAGGRIGVFAPRVAFGDRFGPPRSVVRTIEPSRRVVVRQYVRDDTPGLFAPSVALLAALDDNRRRELRERRYSERDRYQREMQELERDRADRIRELRQEADARGDALERERREAIGQRQQRLERFNQERRERARQVQAPAGAPRSDQPSGQPGIGAPNRQDPLNRQQGQQRGPDMDQRPDQQQQPGTAPQRQQLDQRRPTQPDVQQLPGQQDRRQPQTDQRPDQQQPGTAPQRQQLDQRRPPQPDAQQPPNQQQDRRQPQTDQRPDQQQRPDTTPQRQQPEQRRPTQPDTQQPPSQQQDRRQPQTNQRPDQQQRPDTAPQRQQPEQRRPPQPDAEQPRGQQQPRQQMPPREGQGQGQRPQQEKRRPEQAPGQQGGSNDPDNARPDPRRQPVPPQ